MFCPQFGVFAGQLDDAPETEGIRHDIQEAQEKVGAGA